MADSTDTSAAVDAYLGSPAQLGARARMTMSDVVSSKPDYEAELRYVAGKTGVPVDTVRAYPDEMKKQATLGAYDFDRMASEFPNTAKFLAEPDKAAVGHDDYGFLVNAEQAAKYFFSAPGKSSTLLGDAKAAYFNANSGTAGAFGAVARTVGAPLDFLENFPSVGGNPFRRLSEGFLKIADADAATAKLAAGKSSTWLGGAISSGVQSLVQNAPLMLTAFLPGGQAAALAGMGAMSGGQTYQKDMAGGISPNTALLHALSDATIEIGTEMGPLGGLVKELKAGTPLMTSILKNAWAENKGEQVATALQDLNDWAVNDVNKGKTFTDYLKARPEAAAQTAIAVLVGAGGNVAIMQSVQTAVDRAAGFDRGAQVAEHHAQVFEALQKTAEASKLLQRSPDTLRTYMQDLVDQGVPTVFIDSAALTQAGVDMQQLAQALPSVAAQLAQLETGGDLAIPTGELLVGSVGSTFAQQLIDHARTSESSMSRAEAKVYMQQQGDQLKAEIDQVLQQRDNDAEFKAGRDKAQSQLLEQLNTVNRFTPAVNQQYATLAANFYAVMAARTGMTVEQFADTYKLGFAGQAGVGGQVLDQRDPGTLFHGTSSDVQKFSRIEGGNMWGPGYYLTDDPGTASGYATGKAGNRIAPAGNAGPNVMPVRMTGELFDMAAPLDAKTLKRVEKASGQKLKDYTWPGMKNRDLRQVLSEQFTDVAGANALLAKAGYAGLAENSATAGAGRTVMAFGAKNISSDFDGKVLNQSAAQSIRAQAAPENIAQQSADPDTGLPQFASVDGLFIGFAAPTERLEFIPTDDGLQMLNFVIMRDGKMIGSADLLFEGDKLTSLYDIEVDAAGRGKGDGAAVIQALLAADPSRDVEISNIVESARGFWESVGVPTQNLGQGEAYDGKLNWQTFTQSRAGKRAARNNDVASSSTVSGIDTSATGPGQSSDGQAGNQLNQSARGQIAFGDDITKQASIISMLKGADLSTFIHEGGHFFLEVQADLAARIAARAAQGETVSEGEQSIADDMNKLLDWMGVKGNPQTSALGEWLVMPLDQKRQYHERFARGFEAYAFEGKAPSLDLQKTFQTFRAWLVSVYRAALKSINASKTDIGGALDVDLTPEVRSVMDRMLATTNQIAEAEAARNMGPLFKTAEAAGMTADEYKAYHDQGVQASMNAVDELQGKGLRDMQWLQNARSRKLKELQKQHDALRREVTMGVRAEVMAQPIYRAWTFLTAKGGDQLAPGLASSDGIDATQAVGKLRTQDLRDMYGTADDAVWRKVSELRMTSDQTGLSPDVVAELFGFSSGDEMVRALAEAEPPKSAIEGLTDQRMLEQHGDLATPAGIERAADQAIHNDARVRFVATELAALQKAISVREKVPGQRNTVDVLARAAKDYAAATIAKLKVRDIRPGQYTAAETRSAKAAQKAVGDIAQATLHKRNQLINMYAAKAAYTAQDEVKTAVEYFKKFDTVRKSLDPEYQDQIHALLERFDLRQGVSLKALDKRASLVEWAQSQIDQGMEPDIPPELLQEANRKSFKEMTVEEVRGLRDTIKQIEHLGRLKNKLLTAQANREFAGAVDEIVSSIDLYAGDRQADTRTPNTLPALALLKMKNFWASHIKAATWARVMDGGKDGGKMWEYLIRTANKAGDTEVVMREKATKELAALAAPMLAQGKMGGKGTFYPGLSKSLNHEAKITIALNLGNASNTQRLLGGEGWTIEQIQPVLNSLTAVDWKFVQGVWDHFEQYRPLIAEKEKRVYGKEPNWIEATPVTTAFGVLRGGYYPVKYDPRASERAESNAQAEDAKRQLAGAYTSATTRRSFTKNRVDEVNGRPLLMSMDGIYNGVQEVIHDLTWHEWLIDANKLVRNKKISTAIREKYGPEVHQQFKKWIEDNAAGERGAQDAGEMAANWVRQGVSVSGLGFNVMSALMQPLGLTQSIVRIGPKWVGKGISKTLGSPLETVDEINGKSEFMRTRALTRLREIAEVRSQVKGRTKVRETIDASAYFLMMRAQQMVDVPTWWGAYEKAIAEGNDELRAVALSDQAVIDSQGGGSTKDLSGIERGGPYLKLFTTFYTFFNTTLNNGVATTMTESNKAKVAANYLLLFIAPAILGAALKDAMTPGDSGDWDEEKILKRLIGEQLSFLFGLMVGVREMAGAAQALTGTAQYSTDYSGPAGLRVLADAVKLGKQVNQAEMDDGLRKAIVNTAGQLLRLPSAQINRTITGVQALNEGKTDNWGALLTGYQEPR